MRFLGRRSLEPVLGARDPPPLKIQFPKGPNRLYIYRERERERERHEFVGNSCKVQD